MTLDPAVITALTSGAATLIGLAFNWYTTKRREDRRDKRDAAVRATIIEKIDENTKVNAEQINVSNHVNDKILQTNTIAVDALATVREDVQHLRTDVTDMGKQVRANTSAIVVLFAQRAEAD